MFFILGGYLSMCEYLTVLIVEDEPVSQMSLKEFLIILGHKVVTASNGREALAIIAKHPIAFFDLIITDMQMPEMNGQEFIQHLSKINFQGIIIATSGNSNFASVMAKLKIPFIAKPFDLSIVEYAIDQNFKQDIN